jgi:hypothetical protein
MIFSSFTLAVMIASTMTMILFGYMSKNHQRNTRAKVRKIARLKGRARKLDNIIFNLPATYLPKTLKVLIYASIVDSLRQMHSLSGNDNINRQIERVNQTLSTLVDLEPSAAVSASLDSSLELKECKYLLKDLYSLILEFHSEGSLNKNTTHAHLEIVKSLMLKVTLDTYKTAANAALIDNNLGLARHYNSMALNRLNQDQDQDQAVARFDEEKQYFTEQVASLDLKIKNSVGLQCQQDSSEEAVLAEWKALESAKDDDWKKKRY